MRVVEPSGVTLLIYYNLCKPVYSCKYIAKRHYKYIIVYTQVYTRDKIFQRGPNITENIGPGVQK